MPLRRPASDAASRPSSARAGGRLVALLAVLVLAACGAPDPGRAAGEGPAASRAAPPPGDPDAGSAGAAFEDLPPADAGDVRVAEVGGTPIWVSDVRREAAAQEASEAPEELSPGDPVFDRVLEELIEQRLLALEARRRGLHREPEARHRLAAAEERILGNILVETAVSQAVTDEAIRRVYEEQTRLAPRTEEVRARHILVTRPEEAEEVVRLVEDGEDFASLARRVSQDPATRFEGGDLGYFTRDAILPEFARAAFDTPVGAVAEPFQTEMGWHVLTVVDRRVQPRPGLELMRPNIVRFLTLEGIQVLLEDIRESYPVTRLTAPAPETLRTDPADPEPDALDVLQDAADSVPAEAGADRPGEADGEEEGR